MCWVLCYRSILTFHGGWNPRLPECLGQVYVPLNMSFGSWCSIPDHPRSYTIRESYNRTLPGWLFNNQRLNVNQGPHARRPTSSYYQPHKKTILSIAQYPPCWPVPPILYTASWTGLVGPIASLHSRRYWFVLVLDHLVSITSSIALLNWGRGVHFERLVFASHVGGPKQLLLAIKLLYFNISFSNNL